MDSSQPITVENDELLVREARRLEEDVLYSEKAHFAMATVWARLHYALGVPSAILAAAAGVSALKHFPEIAAAMAIGAAILTTLMTFLDPEKARSEHHAAGIRYSVLRGKLRRLYEIDLKTTTSPLDYRTILETLAEEKARIMQSARHTGGLAYTLGIKSIGKRQHAYEVDRKLT
jgi:hypothetical protein